MSKFRYRVLEQSKKLDETKLNEFGRRGYELTGVVFDGNVYTYYFKTEVSNG